MSASAITMIVRSALRATSVAFVVLAIASCAAPTLTPTPAPSSVATPPEAAKVRIAFTATGLVRCGVVPDWSCGYVIRVQDPDGTVHQGYFNLATSLPQPSASALPAAAVVGDVPVELAPGTYLVTFLKQRFSDVASFVAVPGGTPMETTAGDVFESCQTTVEVSGAADVTVKAAFGLGSTLASPFSDPRCSATSVATPRS